MIFCLNTLKYWLPHYCLLLSTLLVNLASCALRWFLDGFTTWSSLHKLLIYDSQFDIINIMTIWQHGLYNWTWLMTDEFGYSSYPLKWVTLFIVLAFAHWRWQLLCRDTTSASALLCRQRPLLLAPTSGGLWPLWRLVLILLSLPHLPLTRGVDGEERGARKAASHNLTISHWSFRVRLDHVNNRPY